MSSESGCWNDYHRGDRVCCLKSSSRRFVAPILLLTLITLIIVCILRVNYLFLGYIIFVLCIVATGTCETCYGVVANFQGKTFACCRRRAVEDTDDEVTIENGSPESLTAWATRSISTNDGQVIVPSMESDTAPPSYNDVIINDEAPPPSYNDVITNGTHNKAASADG